MNKMIITLLYTIKKTVCVSLRYFRHFEPKPSRRNLKTCLEEDSLKS